MSYRHYIASFIGVLFFAVMPSGQTIAAVSDPIVETLAPAGGSYVLGETVDIQWKINKSGAEKPAFIYLQATDSRWQRLIGIEKNLPMGEISEFKWKIPDNLFAQIGTKDNKASFKIRISAKLERRWVRGRGRAFEIMSAAMETSSVTDEGQKQEAAPEEKSVTGLSVTDINQQSITSGGEIPVARYQFSALYEPWEVQRITVVNDSESDGFDADADEATHIVSDVFVRYINKEGLIVRKKGVFAANRAVISGMDFYVPQNGSANLEIWAEVADFSTLGPDYSGRTFRLGIQDKNNSGASFDAIGLISSNRDITFSKINAKSTQDIKEFMVRKTAPVFKLKGMAEQTLVSGDNTVFEFSVSSKNSSALSLGRLVFDVAENGIGRIDQVEFFRGSNRLKPGDALNNGQVNLMWDTGASSCFANTVQSGAGTGMDCNGSTVANSKLIISFTGDEIISDKTDYKIRLNVQDLDKNASLQIRLSDGDEDKKPDIGGAVPTTGYIYNSIGTGELFSNAVDFVSEATGITDRNIIWSDISVGSQHDFPSVSPALMPITGTDGSSDFTNGYLLNIDELPEVNLKY